MPEALGGVGGSTSIQGDARVLGDDGGGSDEEEGGSGTEVHVAEVNQLVVTDGLS